MSNCVQVKNWIRSYKARFWDKDLLGTPQPYKRASKESTARPPITEPITKRPRKKRARDPSKKKTFHNFMDFPKEFKDWSSYWDSLMKEQNARENAKEAEPTAALTSQPQTPTQPIPKQPIPKETLDYVKRRIAERRALRKKWERKRKLLQDQDRTEDIVDRLAEQTGIQNSSLRK